MSFTYGIGPTILTEYDFDPKTGATRCPVDAATDDDGPLTISEALPDFDLAKHGERLAVRFPLGLPPYKPCGHWVLVQDRSAMKRTPGGIITTDTQQQLDAQEEFLGRVIAIGNLAGYDKINDRDVPGWPWYRTGNFVALPRYSTNRHQDPKGDNPPMYRMLHWEEVLGVVTSVEVLL